MSMNTTKPHQKTFSDCFNKIKKPHLSSSTAWVLRGCRRRPRTQSFAFPDSGRGSEQATKVDQFLFENFRSTYPNDQKHEEDDEKREGSRLNPEDSIAVLTCGSNPYEEFKRSMREVIEERLKHHGELDWEFMEELLLCYLNLNDKKSYKFVLSAFVDLIAVFEVSSGTVPAIMSSEIGSPGH
ncbi:unnamed protein product [Cuscuta campestris]|uniref:Transcription repressor n=1 Tax=Cuscuta campestris TaxID=132261 RepID=A0A484MWL7_9ASTE|nr:unnamed protein product [Cuscuta campestris]